MSNPLCRRSRRLSTTGARVATRATRIVAPVAVLVLVILFGFSPAPLHSQDPADGANNQPAAPRELSTYVPGSAVLYLEWPDTARNSKWLDLPEAANADADALRMRADLDRFRNQSAKTLADAFGFTAAEAQAFQSGSDAMAGALLDVGQDFSYMLLAVRHSKREAVLTALARVAKADKSRVVRFQHGNATGYTITVPDSLDEFGDVGPLQAMPMGQDPYAMLISMAGNEIHLLPHGDCLLLANRKDDLTAAFDRKPEESIATTKSFTATITDAHRAAGMFGFADAGNVRDLIERNLDNRMREDFDRANSLLEMQHMVAGVGHSSMRADGFRAHMRLALDGHETWKNFRLGVGELQLVNAMPADSLAVFGFAFPDPPKDVERLIAFARAIATAAGEEQSFNEGLDEFEGELGVPSLVEIARPFGTDVVFALLPPSPPVQRDDGYPYYYLDESPEGVLVISIKDVEGFEDAWKRFLDSPQISRSMDLDETELVQIDGVPAHVTTNQWGGICWARVKKNFVICGDRFALESMIRSLNREPGSAGTLGAAAGWKQFRGSFPDKVSKLICANLGVLATNYSPQADDVIARLGAGAWIGLSTEETDHLDVRVHLYADGFPHRMVTAISEAYQQMRLAGCQQNLSVLGNAIRDYQIDKGRYPESIQEVVEAGKFSWKDNGRSPVDVFAAELAGKGQDEIDQIRSYEYLKPVAPEKLDPGMDEPWGPPIHSFLLAWTTNRISNGGRHVLMSNGTVHWVTEEHFAHLKKLASQGMTQAELDEQWNRQAGERRRQAGEGDDGAGD